MENTDENYRHWVIWLLASIFAILLLGWLFRNNPSLNNSEIGQVKTSLKKEIYTSKYPSKKIKFRTVRR